MLLSTPRMLIFQQLVFAKTTQTPSLIFASVVVLQSRYEKKRTRKIHICYVSCNNSTMLDHIAEMYRTSTIWITKMRISGLMGR